MGADQFLLCRNQHPTQVSRYCYLKEYHFGDHTDGSFDWKNSLYKVVVAGMLAHATPKLDDARFCARSHVDKINAGKGNGPVLIFSPEGGPAIEEWYEPRKNLGP